MNLESNVIDRLNLQYGGGTNHHKRHHHRKGGLLWLFLLLPLLYLFYKALQPNEEERSSEPYLPIVGGTMEGDIVVPACKHVSIVDMPKEDNYAANKKYVDSMISGQTDQSKEYIDQKIKETKDQFGDKYLSLDGGTLKGPLKFSSGTMTLTEAPEQPDQAANKEYVDKQSDSVKAFVDDTIAKTTNEYGKTFLSITGGTLTGDLTFAAPNTLNILGPPTSGNSAVNKNYIDTVYRDFGAVYDQKLTENKEYVADQIEKFKTSAADTYLPLAGGTMKGDIVVPTNKKITILDPPQTDTSATNKKYVDGKIQDALVYSDVQFESLKTDVENLQSNTGKTFLPLSGGTMTGPLTMGPGASLTITDPPNNPSDAVNKGFVDKGFADTKTAIDASMANAKNEYNSYVNSELQKIQASSAKTFLPLTGGTLTGDLTSTNIIVNRAPVKDLDATNKLYVDAIIASNKTYIDQQIEAAKAALQSNIAGSKDTTPYLKLTGGTLTGPLIVTAPNTVTIEGTPTSGKDAINKSYMDTQIAAAKKYFDDQSSANYLPLTGGTMKGSITLPSGKFVTLTDQPKNPTDAANKLYVDNQIGTIKSNYLPLAGGTMTGDITMSGTSMVIQPTAPTKDTDAVNKAYVDSSKLRSYYQYSSLTVDGSNNISFATTVLNQSFVAKSSFARAGQLAFVSSAAQPTSWRIFLVATFPKDTTVSFNPETRVGDYAIAASAVFKAGVPSTFEHFITVAAARPNDSTQNAAFVSSTPNLSGVDATLTILQIS